MKPNAFRMNPRAMAEIEARAQRVQENVLEDIARDARRHAPVETGELKASIHVEGDSVVAESDHSVYVELGTRHMHAQPYLRPALYKRRNLRVE
jgi:HK97 gp10 family phage protein